jgi:hypothetical protein
MRSVLAAGAVLAATLACASAPPPGVVYVDSAPPAVRVEAAIASPGPGYVWVPGYWNWSGSAYLWAPGIWQLPPRPHARWIAPEWRHTSRGWYRVDGHWR